jgi:rare lipoprotein A
MTRCHSRLSSLAFLLATGFTLAISGCLPASTRSGAGIDPALRGGAALAVDAGEASYYGDEFDGRRTASGETFRQSEMTAAHRTYPFGTIVRVINLKNGLETAVRINDRGPQKPTRVIDLTRRAAEEIGMVQTGVAQVRLEVVRWGS